MAVQAGLKFHAIAGPTTDPDLQLSRIDLSHYISSATMVRLVTSPSFDAQDTILCGCD